MSDAEEALEDAGGAAGRLPPERSDNRARNVADLRAEMPDAAHQIVKNIYAKNPPYYAVYQTAERVMVHFADDPEVSSEQRKVLSQLAPLRGETNGLIDDWREKPDQFKVWGIVNRKNGAEIRKRARRYDRRIADALVVALEGDLTGAGAFLQGIKDDVLEERTGWSRFEYLTVAICVAFFFIFLVSFIAWISTWGDGSVSSGTLTFLAGIIATTSGVDITGCQPLDDPRCYRAATELWRGAMAGALGSFFSIALGIRKRTILPDLNRYNNFMDAALRVAIGIIAGTVLVALVVSDFVTISIGDAAPGQLDDLYLGIVGFLGGFAERLVPDLLEKVEAKQGEKPVLRKPEPEMDDPSASTRAGTPAHLAVGEGHLPVPEEDVEPDDGHEDGCIEDLKIEDEDLTPDDALPASAGGVEKPEGEPVP
ncbi:MAG: hypothetical protein AB3N06_08640 [Erythrobacter sp.]